MKNFNEFSVQPKETLTQKLSKKREIGYKAISSLKHSALLVILLILSTVANAATYYSRANAAWNVASTWSTIGYGGAAAVAFPTTGDIVNIGNSNTVTVSANATCASITIDASGIINPTGTATISATTSILINGTYTNQSTGAITTPSWTCNGTYNHATSSVTLPLGSTSSTWASNSNLNITGSYTVATVFLNFAGQTFGNFTFNPGTMTNTVALVGAAGTTTIQGNFTITQTGSSTLYMRIFGQQFANTLNINGNFIQSAGIYDLHNGGPTVTAQVLNLNGNFTLSGSSVFTQTTTQSGSTVRVNFTGSGVQTVSISPTATISSQITTATCATLFNASTGSTIDLGTSVLTGTNNTSFTLGSGATLITANTGGISTTGATGAIQVAGVRTYSSTANYTYNGNSSQITGTGLPISINNLTLNNSAGITLSAAVTVNGTIEIGSTSVVNLNSLTSRAISFTINGSTQALGSYGGTGSGATYVNTTNFTSGTGQLIMGAPSGLSYTTPNIFATGVAIASLNPTVSGTVTSYSVSPGLPAGLNLNTSTGVITGTPSANSVASTYTITASNAAGSTTFGVVISATNNRYAVANTSWDLTSTWSFTSGGTAGAPVPSATDIVYIGDAAVARAVSIPTAFAASCATLNIGNSTNNTANSLTFSANTSTLTVGGNVTINRPAGNNINAFNINAGTVTVNGTVTLAGTATQVGRINKIVITTGILTISGNLVFTTGSAANNVIDMSGGNGTLNLAGAFTATVGTLTPGTTSTFNYNGGAQTVTDISSIAYNNLTLSGTGAKTLVAATTTVKNLTLSGSATATTVANLAVTGNLTIGTGTTFATGLTFTLSVTGNTTIGGTFTLAGTSAKTFTGDVTVNSGGVWNETGIAAVNFSGSLQHNGTTFTALTGLHTLSGTGKTISGSSTIAIANTAITGTYTNSATLTVSTALTGTGGTLTNGDGTTGTLNITGTSTISSLIATAIGNTVNYNGAAQTVITGNYYNLGLAGSATKTVQTGTTTIANNFSLSGTCNTTAVIGLTIGGNVTIGTGTQFTAGAFTHNVGGSWTKNGTFTATGSSINFNGTGATQNIGTCSFNNVSFAGAALKTATGILTITGNTTIDSNFAAGNYVHTLSGNWTNNGTFTSDAGTINLIGTSPKTIGGTSASSFYNLTINGTGGVTLGNNSTALGTLTLTSGLLDIGNYNLFAALISGGNISSYVKTSGTGRLRRTITAGGTVYTYPIGKSAYNPISISSTATGSGNSDDYSLRVADAALTNTNVDSKTVSRKWYISSSSVGVTSLTINATYNSGETSGSFNASNSPKVGYFSGSTWAYGSAVVTGSGPFTFTSTGSSADMTSANGFLALGSDDAFSASKLSISVLPPTPFRGVNSSVATIQSQNSSGIPTYLSQDTYYDLTSNKSFTRVGGLTGLLFQANSYQTIVNNIQFLVSTWDSDLQQYAVTANVTATRSSGEVLTTGVTPNFAIKDGNIYKPSASGNWSTVQWMISNDGGSTWTNTSLPVDNIFSETDVIKVPIDTVLTADVTASFYSMIVFGTLDINSSGALTVNHTTSDLSDYNIKVYGTLKNSGGALVNSNSSYIAVDVYGGNYLHAMNGGSIPVSNWYTLNGTLSTCNITGISSSALTAGLNQNFQHFIWDNASQSVTQNLSDNLTVNGTLTLSNGIITTGAFRVIVNSTSSVLSTNNSHINGNLRIYVPNTVSPSVLFPIGDDVNYAPVSIDFTGTISTAGYLEASTTISSPPLASGLSQSKYINRIWTLTNTNVSGFSSFSPTFTFVDGDKAGSPSTSNLVIRKLDNSLWTSTTTGIRTANSTQCTGLTTFSEFAIGEDDCTSTNYVWLGGTNTDWNTASNWCNNAVPSSTVDVTIPSGPTNQPIIGAAGASCKNLLISNGASLTISGANLLNITGNLTNSGTLTTNTSTISFTASSAQSITGTTTFNNLTVNNAAGVTSASNLTVNGILYLQSANASATTGALNMGNNTLSLGANATNTGIGQVTGIITRTHSFSINTIYTFGGINSTLRFNAVTGSQTFPTSVSVKTTIGSDVSWGTTTPANAAKRLYEISYTGSPSGNHAIFRTSYLDSELASGTNESSLAIWSHVPGTDITTDEGWSSYDVTQNYITISDIDFAALPTTLQVCIAPTSTTIYTWNGSQSTDWNTASNWTPNGLPNSTVGTVIPDGATTTYDPSLPVGANAEYLIIESGGILNSLSNATLTLAGHADIWTIEPAADILSAGIFNAGNSTVTISNTTAFSTIVGSTDFYNLTVLNNAQLRMTSGSYIGISGTLSLSTNGVLDARTSPNTIEFKGNNQTIPNTNFATPGYYNLIINSGSTGTNTWPSTLNISGDFTNDKSGLSIPGTVIFEGSTAQAITGTTGSTFQNLTINNTTGVTGSADITVNGTLNLASDNPATNDKGTLDMINDKVLTMGINATTTGTGDVSGIITRAHNFTSSTFYSFGHVNNGITFAVVSGYPGQTFPTSLSLKVSIGNAPDWSAYSGPTLSNPIKRHWELIQTGASGTRALMRVHYNDNEVPAAVNENQLTIWTSKYVAGTFYNKESGRSGYDVNSNYVTIQDIDLAILPTTWGQFKTTLAPSSATDYTWIGTVSTDWNEPSNWTPNGVPDATHGAIIPNTYTTTYAPTLPASASCLSLQINAGGVLNAATSGGTFTLTGANNAWTVEAGGIFNANTSGIILNANATSLGDVSIVGSTNFYNLTIATGTLLRPAANSYIGIAGTLSNSGTLAAATTENTIEFNGSEIQNIPNANGSAPGYHNLVLSGSGTKNLPLTLNIVDEFSNNTTLAETVVAGSGTVSMDGNSTYGQTISGSAITTFNNLTINNPADVVSVIAPIAINGTLNITTGSVMDMDVNELSGIIAGTIGAGILYTQNPGSTPIPSGKTWVFPVVFNGIAAQTITAGTFTNLIINNPEGITASGNVTVNGTLDLQSNNPTSTQGTLEMGANTLNMGISAITTGVGDVTGNVKRTHIFTTAQSYSFGNQYTNLTFMGISGLAKPNWVNCLISIGTAPDWKTGGVFRTYNFTQDGSGTDKVVTNLHYLDSELNSNDESKLVLWDHHSSGTIDEHGKSTNNLTNNWVGFSGITISYLAPATSKQWALSASGKTKNTWLGVDELYPTKWDIATNWSAGHFPGDTGYLTDSVLIPTGLTYYPILTMSPEMATIELEDGTSLTANSYNVTINGYTGAWLNNGTFNSTSGSVNFTHGNLLHIVTLGGINNNFYNLQVSANTYLQPTSGSYIKIANSIVYDGSSVLDFTANLNTVEFNGTNQTITNLPNPSSTNGYHDFVISGTGTKTLPAILNIAGDFTNNGTVDTGTGTVVIKDQGHVQNIGGTTTTTFYNLTIDNTDQLVNARSNFNVSNTFTVNSSATMDMITATLGGDFTSTSGTGILKTQSTSNTSLPTGKTWAFSVVYNNATTAQTVPAGNYASLQISNPTSVTASGTLSCNALTIDNGATLNMNTSVLTGLSSFSSAGTLKTQNTSSTPITAGFTWPGVVVYNGSGSQTAVAGTYNNLNIDNAAGVSVIDSIDVNGTLLINSGKKMIITPKAKVYANLITNNAGAAGLTVKASSSEANGTLIFNNNSGSPVQATVEMYCKASWDLSNSTPGGKYKWQFFGIPVTGVEASPVFDGDYVRLHNEAGRGSGYTADKRWIQLTTYSSLSPFKGYEITQPSAKTYSFQGQLVNSTFSQSLSYTSSSDYPGQHILSNPYTAAIDIEKLTFGDDLDKTVYLYNTGSYADWSQAGTDASPGQYVAAPLAYAGVDVIPHQIPSMQGFMIAMKTATPSLTTFEIPYSAVSIRNKDQQRVRATNNVSEKVYTRIDIKGESYSDKMWIFTDPNCSHGFDNGFDGSKVWGSTIAPQLWSMESTGDYQVNAVDNMNNTELGFVKGEDATYTLTFTHSNLQSKYESVYLLDLGTNITTDITQSGSTYTFSTQATTQINRFRIITNPNISTGNKSLENNSLRIYNTQQSIFVYNSSSFSGELVIYDIMGRYVQKYPVNASGLTTIPTSLPTGAYLLKTTTPKEINTKQIIIQ